MNRTLSVERLYTLGDYRNIKFGDVISDLPENVAMNKEAVEKIRFLQMLEVESAYRHYTKLNTVINSMTLEESMKYIDEVKLNTLEELKEILKS